MRAPEEERRGWIDLLVEDRARWDAVRYMKWFYFGRDERINCFVYFERVLKEEVNSKWTNHEGKWKRGAHSRFDLNYCPLLPVSLPRATINHAHGTMPRSDSLAQSSYNNMEPPLRSIHPTFYLSPRDVTRFIPTSPHLSPMCCPLHHRIYTEAKVNLTVSGPLNGFVYSASRASINNVHNIVFWWHGIPGLSSRRGHTCLEIWLEVRIESWPPVDSGK